MITAERAFSNEALRSAIVAGLFLFSRHKGAAIGHGNKTEAPKTEYITAVNQAKEKTPQEEALGKASLKTLDWANAGDYRDPRGGGLFVNYADPAMLHRNRELQSNEHGQGIEGLGVADPNYLATVKENRLAQNEQMDAAQYEGDIKGGIEAAAGYAGDTSKLDLSRKLGVLGATEDIYKGSMNKPKWWQYLIGGASAAATGLAGNPGLFK